MKIVSVAIVLLAAAACGGAFGREYEYEEQLYLNADGSAAVVVNASVPALIALRGLALDPDPRERIDRTRVREMVSEPGVEITRVSRPWRRNGRQFIQIRAEVDNVETLGQTKLFGWSAYAIETKSDPVTSETTREYKQIVSAPSGTPPANAGWDGSELVAFKLHLPSRVLFQNARLIDTNEPRTVERGNIVTWEQRLSDRLQGKPIDLQVTMNSGSILYTTLSLFALSFAAAMVVLVGAIWIVIRRGRRKSQAGDIRS